MKVVIDASYMFTISSGATIFIIRYNDVGVLNSFAVFDNSLAVNRMACSLLRFIDIYSRKIFITLSFQSRVSSSKFEIIYLKRQKLLSTVFGLKFIMTYILFRNDWKSHTSQSVLMLSVLVQQYDR